MNNNFSLNSIFKLDNETSASSTFFNNHPIDEKYFQYNFQSRKWNMKFGCILIIIAYLVYIIITQILDRTTKFNLAMKIIGIIIDILMTLIQLKYFNFQNMMIIKISSIVRYCIFYFIMLGTFLFTTMVFQENTIYDKLSNFFIIILIYTSLLLMYFFDYHIVYVILYLFITTIIYVTTVRITFPDASFFNYFNLIMVYLFDVVLFTNQRQNLNLSRSLFIENYRNEKISDYVRKLLDDINLYIISMKKHEIVYINQKFQNELNLNTELTNLKEEIKFDSTKVSKFFENLELIGQEKKLGFFIDSWISEELIRNENEFISIGQFKTKVLGEERFFEIYFRKNHFNDEIILDILLYDLTKIKKFEREVCESKYKQKILGKIAHEFKTPLITISSMINSINENEGNHLFLLSQIQHIKNLSDYTIYLISDVISYVSDKIDHFDVQKERIDLKEVTLFSFNVLNTLVECNETKSKQIKTVYEFDDKINSINVYSDEIRLKQILLNLVSNAFKFTKNGEIKMSVSLEKTNKEIRICIKDSGIGINPDIESKILKEIAELNVDMQYNKHGSGIGLSISKMLSNLLNHKISFRNRKKGGTAFLLDIDITDSIISDRKELEDNSYMKINSFENEMMDTVELKEYYYNKNEIFNTNEIEVYSNRKNQMRRTTIISNNNTLISVVIIDDLKYVRESTKNIVNQIFSELGFWCYRIYEGDDGIDLLSILKNDQMNDLKIKLILIDENMEYMSGSESIKIIRNFEQLNKFKKYQIYSVTAFEDNETKNTIMKSNPDGIINKPCSKGFLLNLLKNMIEMLN